MSQERSRVRRRRRPVDDDLAPETIVPAQFHSRTRADSSMIPEKRLLLAVLEEALATLRQHAGSRSLYGQRLFREAQRWFASNETSWPCSFVNVCDALDIDVSRLRSALGRWVQAGRGTYGGRAGTKVVARDEDRRSA